VLNKTRTTFLQSYVLDNQVGGRIHAQFNPLRDDDGGTVSGRFSSSDPNLQNLPARNEGVGPLVRGLFLPEEGQLWAACDYSQQEPRLTVHYAALAKCSGAEAAVAAYQNDPTTDYHQLVAELTGLPRGQAKSLNLGMIYGMGGARLCHTLGLPTVMKTLRSGKTLEVPGEEGDTIIKQYHAKLPFVRELQEAVRRRAENTGYIRTLLGRRCRFGEGKDYAHKALNRLIQGSAADQSKAAMLNLWEGHGIAPLVVVHDELGCSVESEEQGSLVARTMEEATPLRVPSRADVGYGASWGEAKH
jgi:DNA polymerase I-like protein with 3'-5' exonuclease and polymerase domains